MEKNHLKKYRLIREYPGSPKLDSIVETKSYGGYVLKNSTPYFMTNDMVENYPEYWEEIIEYPIGTKVYNSKTDSIYTKKEDGWYKPAEKTAYTDEMIGTRKYLTVLVKEEVIKKNEYKVLTISRKNTKNHIFRVRDFDIETGAFLSKCTIESDSACKFNPDKDNYRYIERNFNIHSVKRLSDGEVFQVNDNLKQGKIKSIIIENEKIYLEI